MHVTPSTTTQAAVLALMLRHCKLHLTISGVADCLKQIQSVSFKTLQESQAPLSAEPCCLFVICPAAGPHHYTILDLACAFKQAKAPEEPATSRTLKFLDLLCNLIKL